MIKLKSNKRPIFYALVLTLSTYIVIDIKHSVSIYDYLYVISFNLILFLFELLSIYLISKSKLQQFDIPEVHTYLVNQKFIHFLLIPMLLFSSINLFIFFNPFTRFNIFILLLTFFLYTALFINVRAYCEDKFKLEQLTHFIYPTIILFSVFSFINALLSILDTYGINAIFGLIMIFTIILALNTLLFLEDLKLNIILFGLIILTSFATSVITLILFTYFDSKLRTAFFTSNIFYLISALLFHKKEGTLTFEIIIEYILFSILNFTLLYGIS